MEKIIFIEETNNPKKNNRPRNKSINKGVYPDGVVIKEITQDKKWDARAKVIWNGVISCVEGVECSLRSGSVRMSNDWRLLRLLAQSGLRAVDWFCVGSDFSCIPVIFKG